MNQNEREQFFADQVTQGDFEATTGYARHRPKGMTAQYLNECVDKRNGMEVADKDGEVWGGCTTVTRVSVNGSQGTLMTGG